MKDSIRWRSLREKIEHNLDKSQGDCWLWTRATSSRGYGHVWWEGKLRPAHRAYLIELGYDVPDGMDVDHLCRVHGCCNPAHLEVVTHKVNIQRGETGKWARGDYCKHGHEFTPQNTYITTAGHRQCRECHRAANRTRVPCEVCGKEVSASNLAAHRRAIHERRSP